MSVLVMRAGETQETGEITDSNQTQRDTGDRQMRVQLDMDTGDRQMRIQLDMDTGDRADPDSNWT